MVYVDFSLIKPAITALADPEGGGLRGLQPPP